MDYGHKWTARELKKLEKRISAEYKQAADEVEKKLDKYLSNFTVKDQIKQKQLQNGEITEQEYKKWVHGQLMIGERWAEMQSNLAQDLHQTNLKTASMTREFSYDAYAMNFNYGTFEAESGSGIDTAFTLYDRSTVERLIRDDPDMLPPPGKKTAKRIAEGKDVLWNKQQIQSVMTQSILQGESIPNIAKRLAEAVGDSNRKAAIRNARTMTTGAENAGRVDSYVRAENMGIEMKQMWIATLDNRTRHEHRQLDGQKVKVNVPFETGGYKIRFPGDPTAAPEMVYNCRCTLIGVVAGSELDKATDGGQLPRRSKLGEQSYEDWKNEHMPKTPAETSIEDDWINEIQKLRANNPVMSEEDILKAGSIMAKHMQPIKEEYINSISALTQQKETAYTEYNETLDTLKKLDKVSSSARATLADMSSHLLDSPYSELPVHKKKALEYLLEQSKIKIDIKDTDKPRDIMQKLTNLRTDTYNRYSKAIDTYNSTQKELNGKWQGYANGLKAELAKVRSMGIPNTVNMSTHLPGKSAVRKAVISAYDYYPSEWIEQSAAYGPLTAKKVKRGFYQHYSGTIAISGDNDARSIETAIHELGHRFEQTQYLKTHEKEFYSRRTDGEGLKWLGHGYSANERSRFDDFVDPYMGKDYGGSAYELCSMGFEYAYTHPEKLAKDPDMESWILGMLAVC